MPNTFNFLICMLALLIGILIGEKYRKWKKAREEKNNSTGAGIRRTEGENPGKEDAGTDTRKKGTCEKTKVFSCVLFPLLKTKLFP